MELVVIFTPVLQTGKQVIELFFFPELTSPNDFISEALALGRPAPPPANSLVP